MLSLVAPLLVVLHGDQAAWISPAEAKRGAELVRKAGRVAWFCEPCNETVCREEPVSKVTSIPVDAGYHQVVVNGEEADLAYLFIPKDGKWANVALLMKLPVQHVSRTLPRTRCSPDASNPRDDLDADTTPVTVLPDRATSFTIQSPDADRFGLELMSIWQTRPERDSAVTAWLDARILPIGGAYWPTGDAVVLRGSEHTYYRLLELRLERQRNTPKLCDAQACTFHGYYDIVSCFDRAKRVQACILRPRKASDP